MNLEEYLPVEISTHTHNNSLVKKAYIITLSQQSINWTLFAWKKNFSVSLPICLSISPSVCLAVCLPVWLAGGLQLPPVPYPAPAPCPKHYHRVCQMLSLQTKNWPHSINIWDTVTNVVPLCSVHQAPFSEPNLTLLVPFPTDLTYLSMLFILEVVQNTSRIITYSNKPNLTETMLAM